MLHLQLPILAIDPGGTTGTCFFLPPNGSITSVEQLRGCFAYTEIGPDEHHLVLDQFLHQCLMLGSTTVADRVIGEAQVNRCLLPNAPFERWTATPNLTIVNERFEYRKDDSKRREKIEYISAEYVGVVKRFAQLYREEVLYVEHSPSLKDGFWRDVDKLKELHLYQPGKPHAMDALRHCLYYMCFTKNERDFYKFLSTN